MTLLGNQDPDKNKDKDNPEWMKGLPQDLQATPALSKFKPAEGEQLVAMPVSIAKSYVELEKKMGDPDSLLRIPGEKATDEEKTAFFTKIGRPVKQEEYELPNEDPKNEKAKKINDRFRAVAFKHGVSKTAFKELGAEMSAIAAELTPQEGILAVANAEELLKGEWKSEYGLNLKKATLAIRDLGGEDLLTLVNKSGLGAHPGFLKAMVKATSYFPAETMKGIDGQGKADPSLTREKLMEMKRDPRYWDASRRDPAFVKQVEDGYKALYPGEKKIAATDRGEV